MWRTVGGRPGDRLVLTKPVGTGIAATAIKADMIERQETINEAVHWMRTLNALPLHMPDSLHQAVHACTDVTGFGLAGHVLDMLSDGTVDCRLSLEDLPVITGVRELADMGLVPEGAYRNRAAYEPQVNLSGDFDRSAIDMLYDAQTSGGLLLDVSPDRTEELSALARRHGFERTAVIGSLEAGTGRLRVE